jgi:hypothetical protein
MRESAKERDAILALFNQAYDEIKRYRDMEWKMVYWTVGLLAAIVAASQTTPTPPAHKQCVQTLFAIFTLVASGYGAWHIHFIHKNLRDNRNLRRKCEILLGLFDVESEGDPLLPARFKEEVPYSQGLPHLVSWWGLILLTMLYTVYCIILM